MRKIINSTYITLDGVIEDPQDWPALGSLSDEGYEIQTELLSGCDAVLMGRRTYDGFAPVWSTMSGDPYSDRMNAITKYVFSSTLSDPDWANTTVLAGDVAATMSAIKRQQGHNIVQYGFGTVSHQLLAAGLIDELRLWVHPFFLGRGGNAQLLYRDNVTAMFDLADTAVLASGIALLTYTKQSQQS